MGHEMIKSPASTFMMTDGMRVNLGYDDAGNNMSLVAIADHAAMSMNGGVPRASGDVVCKCGSAYRLHPPVQGMLYLTRTCEGIVKL